MNRRGTNRIPIEIDSRITVEADSGCDVSPSCLACPLPTCKYDDPVGFHREQLKKRDEKVWDMRWSQGLSVPQIAQRLGVSPRTITRSLLRQRHDD